MIVGVRTEKVGFTEHGERETLKVTVEQFDDFVVTDTIASWEFIYVVREDVITVVYLLRLHFLLVDPYRALQEMQTQ